MKARKYLFMALLSLLCTLGAFVPSAIAQPSASETALQQIDIPVLTVQDEQDAFAVLNNQLEDSGASPRSSGTYLSAVVIRSGNTSSCELYIKWSGDVSYNAFRYKQLKVSSVGTLASTTFGTFGNGTSYTTRAVNSSPVGSVRIGKLTIRTGVNSVRVTSTDFQAYRPSTSSWVSSIPLSGVTNIN